MSGAAAGAQPKIRWGILSTALIGTKKVIPGMQRSKRGTVDAIASRDTERARRTAGELRIPKAYGSYEELLADPDIDAIYNPLPNNLHVDWTIAAVKAGKHVLCEKPIGMNAEDAARLRSVAGQRHVMEAFMVRHHPQWLRARELIREGAVG
ncbi:MAG TPA: Gfo/Idh/MocA family oxidoreductase, partial [Propylenella sp.]|nr:Gfo/Idh/MocA family oxidoreductase [Propylenella sp.]